MSRFLIEYSKWFEFLNHRFLGELIIVYFACSRFSQVNNLLCKILPLYDLKKEMAVIVMIILNNCSHLCLCFINLDNNVVIFTLIIVLISW